MWSRGPPEAHSWSFLTNGTFFLNTVFPGAALKEGGEGVDSSLVTCWQSHVAHYLTWWRGGAYPTICFCHLTRFFCSCSISQSLSWQQLSCRPSAALCSMATTWQWSTLLQRLVPLPSPSTLSNIIKLMAKNRIMMTCYIALTQGPQVIALTVDVGITRDNNQDIATWIHVGLCISWSQNCCVLH